MDFSSVPDRLAAILARAALRSRRTASPRLGKQHVLSTTTSELDHVPRTDGQLSRGGGGVPAGDERSERARRALCHAAGERGIGGTPIPRRNRPPARRDGPPAGLARRIT